MEKFNFFDLQTQDPVVLPNDSSLLMVFISLNDILQLKDISKDQKAAVFQTFAVYVGSEAKKVQLWKSKEPNSVPIYFGGQDLARFSQFNINELPSFLLWNQKIVTSGPLTLFPKPFIRSLLVKHPEFKAIAFPLNLEISQEKALEQEVKIYQLEQATSSTSQDIEELKVQMQEKDRLISDILDKIKKFEQSRKPQKFLNNLEDSEDYWTPNDEVSQSVRDPLINSPKSSIPDSHPAEDESEKLPSKKPIQKSPVKPKSPSKTPTKSPSKKPESPSKQPSRKS